MARQFNFKKVYEEIDVGGKIYKINFSDENLKRYQQEFSKLLEDYQELTQKDETKMTTDEALEHFEEIKVTASRAIETFLGEGTFDDVYAEAGHSIANVYDLIWYIGEIIREKTVQDAEERRKKYTKERVKPKKK